MKKYICLFLLTFTPFLMANPTWENYKRQTLVKQKTLPGWCTREKAEKLMNLIYSTHPKVCVEIGVFGGSSIYPTAAALKYLDENGVIHAIDPWTKDDCLEGYDPNDANAVWWGMLNLEMIYQDFLRMIDSSQLTGFCNTMRMTSREAVAYFPDESIDILHIDGNHTEEVALTDAELFLPKVKSGGHIWFDDVNWLSTNKATTFLKKHCIFDEANSVGNECWLFHKL